jgi:hypothetical protein
MTMLPCCSQLPDNLPHGWLAVIVCSSCLPISRTVYCFCDTANRLQQPCNVQQST